MDTLQLLRASFRNVICSLQRHVAFFGEVKQHLPEVRDVVTEFTEAPGVEESMLMAAEALMEELPPLIEVLEVAVAASPDSLEESFRVTKAAFGETQ